jgi:glycine/D-amino acid oxidase-like deaminating enzyme
MDLRTNNPFWLMKSGIFKTYPSLDRDVHTDVAIIGGGISGALMAWYLSQAGISAVVADRRHIGMGSTAASTALLQYEIDTPLIELIKMRNEKEAVLSYLLCLESIFELENICRKLPVDPCFTLKPSIQYASYKKHTAALYKEYQKRKEIGIYVDWLEPADIKEKLGFEAPGAILSKHAAELDAYHLTHDILNHCSNNGIDIYDHTEIVDFKHEKKKIILQTGEGKKITAKKIVLASGYESLKYIPKKIAELDTTYAIASEPLKMKDFWYKNSLIWETSRPYLYLRITNDNRILVGGSDSPFSSPAKRDAALPKKSRLLESKFKKLFPGIPFKTDFQWAGTFASTKDGLPYIGCIDKYPNTYFALGCGGNGITFSVIAAKIIRDDIQGITNPYADIFSFKDI